MQIQVTEEVKQFMSEISKRRWQKIPFQKRSEIMKAIRKKGIQNRWAGKTIKERHTNAMKMVEARKKKKLNSD